MDAAACVAVLLQHQGILISFVSLVVFAGTRRELLCPDAKASPANVGYKLCARLLGLVWFVLIMLLGAIMNLYHVWFLTSLIWCLLHPFFFAQPRCMQGIPHILYLYIHLCAQFFETLVCSALLGFFTCNVRLHFFARLAQHFSQWWRWFFSSCCSWEVARGNFVFQNAK